jgi:hypothetical protein
MEVCEQHFVRGQMHRSVKTTAGLGMTQRNQAKADCQSLAASD